MDVYAANMKKTDLLIFDRVLARGTGEVIERSDDILFVYDHLSEARLLACGDARKGISVLDRHADRNCKLLMVTGADTGEKAFERYGFAEKLVCFQAAYFGKAPDGDPAGITVRTADRNDLPLLTETYHLVDPETMKKAVDRGSLLFGYDQGRLIGFIGEHLEGSIGMLYVFPEFRRRGYAAALEKIIIAKTMEKGWIPFGQVETDNHASLALQKKVGMTISETPSVWMWR